MSLTPPRGILPKWGARLTIACRVEKRDSVVIENLRKEAWEKPFKEVSTTFAAYAASKDGELSYFTIVFQCRSPALVKVLLLVLPTEPSEREGRLSPVSRAATR